jgi:hypothetical protein
MITAISVATDGAVFGIDDTQNVVYLKNGNFVTVGRPSEHTMMSAVAALGSDLALTLDTTGQPWSVHADALPGQRYTRLPAATLTSISSGTTMGTWGTNSNQQPVQQAADGRWTVLPGQATQVTVGANNVWSIDLQGAVQRWTGSGWTPEVALRVPGVSDSPVPAIGIHVGSDNALRALGADNRLYQLGSGSWSISWGTGNDFMGSINPNAVRPVLPRWSTAAFREPATPIVGVQLDSRVGMAEFNDALYCAFRANDPTHTVYVTSSADGTNWQVPAYPVLGNKTADKPALAAFRGKLFCVYCADGSDRVMCVISNPDGQLQHWSSPTRHDDIIVWSGPALAVFNNHLYCVYAAFDGSGASLHMTRSAEGTIWKQPISIPGNPGTQVALAVFNNRLYCAYQSPYALNPPHHTLCLISTADGNTWTAERSYQNINPIAAPALAVFDNNLYCAYLLDDPTSLAMSSTSSYDGETWTPPRTYRNILMATPPGLATYRGRLYAGFQSADASNTLCVTSAPA